MKVVVGLGNPGAQYVGTPHNVGFRTVDVLADRLGCGLRRSVRFGARIAKTAAAGEPLLLVKPETYMNRSGLSVGSLLRYYKLAAGDMVVVLDDADLPLGRLRVKPRGGSAGHRGLASVIEHVGGGFSRVRIGVGRSGDRRSLVDYVLTPFAGADAGLADESVGRAADAVMCVLADGVDAAMNRFNAASPPAGGGAAEDGE